MFPKMIVVSTLFFNKTGNQSLLETIKRYADRYDVIFLTSASKKDTYYLSDEEALSKINGKVIIYRVYQIFPNILRRIRSLVKFVIRSNSLSSVNSELSNLSYTKINLLSFELVSIIFFRIIKKLIKKFKPEVICAYEIGAVKSVSKVKFFCNKDIKFIAKYQGTVLGFEYKNIEDNKVYNKYSIDIDAFRLSKHFDLCAITNDGTNGFEVLEHFGVEKKRIISLPNGISEHIEKIKSEVDIHENIPEKINLFTISRLVGWKRVHLSLEIMNSLVNQYKKTHIFLNIYGHGTETEINFLCSLISTYSLGGYVRIHGSVDYTDLAKIYNENHIMLSLYKFTNVTNPVLEAISLNKPVITLHDPNLDLILENVISDRIILFEQNSEEAIIADISKYICNSPFLFQSETKGFNISWDDRIKKEFSMLENM